MKKEKARDELILPKLQSGEELIGFFQAQYTPSWGWYFLIGPLFAFAIRIYFVAVTDKGIHYHKLTFFGKPDTSNYFTWNEIEKVKLSKGLLQAPLKFTFSNGRKLKLKAQLKGMEKIAKLDDRTKEYLFSKSVV